MLEGDTARKREKLRDAIAAVEAVDPKKAIVDSDTSWNLTRAASRVAGVPLHGVYLDCEIRDSLYEFLVRKNDPKMVLSEIYEKFGMARSTFLRARQKISSESMLQLDACTGAAERKRVARDIVERFKVRRQGREPYLFPKEVNMMLVAAGASKEYGDGMSKGQLRSRVREILNENAAALSEGDPLREAYELHTWGQPDPDHDL
ncbi:hypothetical protein T484DRAFT_1832029 [Baffinella frigidus]|nr:hypothetical protein T484DRAFT_1832029 [Cryptophyta sp. CCMP2293]